MINSRPGPVSDKKIKARPLMKGHGIKVVVTYVTSRVCCGVHSC